MNVLLILGAGASRNLGKGNHRMPLMAHWSRALSEALNGVQDGLAEACHLTADMNGPAFEENLGLLLQWEKVRPLEERFELLGSPNLRELRPAIRQARAGQADRLKVVKRTINATLFEQFGHEQLDDDRATAAYQRLLDLLSKPELMVATTNYDRAVETALENLGHAVETGFPEFPNRIPVLNPEGLVDNRGVAIPVIHLHGAVGWYEVQGAVKRHAANEPFNPTLGTPVVLYPDPNKEPLKEAVVNDLWTEFRIALRAAHRILVIGHSLHDPALVAALQREERDKPVVVTYVDETGKAAIEEKLPGALAIELEFGPKIKTKWPLKKLVRDEFTMPNGAVFGASGTPV